MTTLNLFGVGVGLMGLSLMGCATCCFYRSNSLVKFERDFFDHILRDLSDAILTCDLKGKITLMNPACKKLFNIPSSVTQYNDIVEDSFYYADGRHKVSPQRNPLFCILAHETVKSVEFRIGRALGEFHHVRVDGHLLKDSKGREFGAVLVLHNMTERKKMERILIQQATHDELTELPNRALFMDRLSQACVRARRMHTLFAVLFLDLDEFKQVNDRFGHPVGDLLLQQVAHQLKTCTRETDTLARLGGDEFIIILTELNTINGVANICERILSTLALAHLIEGHHIQITASIGVSIFPKNGEDEDILLKNADSAMYLAKKKGRNNVQFYTKKKKTHIEN